MKRFLALITLFALLLSFAACDRKQDNEAMASIEPTEEAVNTAAPTEPAVTPEPTAEPTEEPTPEPTATPEPTPTPEPVAVDFASCAEAVAHLNWGEGEHEVHFDKRWVDYDDQPGCFYIADGKIYVLDRFYTSDTSLLIYDMETGEISRLDVFGTKYGVDSEFAVEGNEIITARMIYNIDTGEETLLQEAPYIALSYECARRLHKVDGEWYLYVSESKIREPYAVPNTDPLTREYKLDRENLLWRSIRLFVHNRKFHHIQLCDGLSYYGVLDRGTEMGEDQYVDYDGSGCHYVVTDEFRPNGEDLEDWLVLTKYSPEGVQLCYTELCLDSISYRNHPGYWYHYFRVDDDGTVWFMMMYDYEVTIYKLHLDY